MVSLKKIKLDTNVNNYLITCNSVLDEAICQYKQALKDINFTKGCDDGLTILLLCNILMSLHVESKIMNMNDGEKEHFVLLVELDNEKYIVDPNFKKYLKGVKEINVRNLDKRLNCNPVSFMINDLEKTQFLQEFLKLNYFNCNDENAKIYFDSFLLSMYNKNKKMKDLIYDTGIMGNEYLTRDFSKKLYIKHHKII